MDLSFPQNPANGQLFETAPNQLYRYSSLTRSWQRIIRPNIPLATPVADGMMSKEDFIKLNNILIPPPQISVTAPGCDPVNNGYIKFEGDQYLTVAVRDENIHENTGKIDFNLNYNGLIQSLIDAGKVRLLSEQGDQGPRGEPGDPGLDSLPVGPYGPDGQPGKNVHWPGALVQDYLNVRNDNRAIVDVKAKKVSPTENYLVVTRANIGNPDACPDTIKPVDKQSPWLLAVSPGGVVTRRVTTSDGRLVCSSACSSALYYLNIETIVDSVRKQFIDYLDYQREIKETYVRTQLDTLSSTFEEQKAALACALERVYSKARNQQARQYLEQSKIAAATADATTPGYKLNVKGIPENGETPEWYKGCDYQSVDLTNPATPIVDPNNLDKGPKEE